MEERKRGTGAISIIADGSPARWVLLQVLEKERQQPDDKKSRREKNAKEIIINN